MTTSPLRTTPTVARTRPRWGRTRVVLLTACYALLSLWALVMAGFGPVVALTVDLSDPSLRFTAVAACGAKVLTLGAAVAVLLSRGRSVLAVRVLLAGQVVWFVADVLAPQQQEGFGAVAVRFVVSALIWVGPWLLLSEGRRRLWSAPVSVRRVPAALTVLASVPLLAWARTNAGLDPSGTLPVGGTYAELRFDVTLLPLALLAGLAMASLFGGRLWWDAVLASVCVAVGVLALVYPDGYGSPGVMGAGLVLAALVLMAERLRGRRHAGGW